MAADSLPLIKWSVKAQQVILKKYKELGLATPCVVRITESSSNSHLPAKLMEEDLVLHSIVPHRKIICQCVDFVSKDGQLYFSSQRFSIPLGYNGWLEILSEDGKTMSPSRTIEHIAERALERFLVRSKTKAFLSSESSGEPDYDRTRIVEKGEVMTIIGRLSITYGWRRQKKQILHCLDPNGLDIYFDFKATGQFSSIAGPTNISGVHSIEGLINQFRLPLTVRIVSGQIPRVASGNDRPGVFRLIETQKDNTALFLPIRSHQKLIPVSVRTNLQLIQASNMSEISQHQYYKQLLCLCNKKVGKYFQTMQLLVSAKQQAITYSARTLPVRKKAAGVAGGPTSKKLLNTEEDVLFAEVDDLYAYVRRGGAPPKPRPRSWATTVDDDNIFMTADGKCSSQPLLSMNNGKPRGLLATLTAGKFPSRSSTLVRQCKVSTSPTTPDQVPVRTFALNANELPVTGRVDKIRSYIDKYQGSMESLQTEVDPYVDEGQYKNSTESIEIARKSMNYTQQREFRPPKPRPFSTPLEIGQNRDNTTSPTDSTLFKAVTQLVLPKRKSHTYKHSIGQHTPIAFLENNTKYHQTLQAT